MKWVKEYANLNVMLCTICWHFYNLKNVKNTLGGVLLLVKLQSEACNFTKDNTGPWVFFTFFKLYKRYQIAQSITNVSKFLSMKWAHLEFDLLLDTLYFVRECSATNHFSQFFFYILHLKNFWAITSLKPLKFLSYFCMENKIFTEVIWTEQRLKNRKAKQPFRGVLRNSSSEKNRKIYKKTSEIESFS